MKVRKHIEKVFGWDKTVGLLRKTRFVGPPKVNVQMLMTLAGFNLVRIRNIESVR